jgi:hypothetical protein
MRETCQGRERNAALWWRKVKRRLFGRSWCKWNNNIKVGVRNIVLKIVDRTHLD